MSEIKSPELIRLRDILPSEPLLLMGAGPVPIPHAVARANSVVINHLGETMDRVIAGLKGMARYAFQTRSDKILGVAGPASAAMEMAIANLVGPGTRVLALISGTFSARLAEMAEGVGAQVTRVLAPENGPITEAQTRSALEAGPYELVSLVQGETSCGVLNVELPAIAAAVKAHGALLVVDAVCTLTTMPLPMDEWQLDVSITGGQKGLSSIPGVSLVAFSDPAWRAVEKRQGPRPHWCLDAIRAQRFWGEQQYHYTAPVPGILAIYEALRLICEETLDRRFKRHALSSDALQAGIEAMGLELFIEKAHRLNSVVAIKLPDGHDGIEVRRNMSDVYGVEIAGAFGLPVVRVGQMGEQCRSHNLFKVLYALGMSFRRAGAELDVSRGMAVMEEHLAKDLDQLVG